MSKASSHFKTIGYDQKTRKTYMTCNYCKKRLIQSGNSNCYVNHLKRCQAAPKLELSNSIRHLLPRPPVEISLNTPTFISHPSTHQFYPILWIVRQ